MSNSGGPAFPVSEDAARFPGISARDYFAAKVLSAIFTNGMHEAEQGSPIFAGDEWRLSLAMDAYAMADAMLEARDLEL